MTRVYHGHTLTRDHADLDTMGHLLPTNGRTVVGLGDYIANNAVVNVLDFAPVGATINDGVSDAYSAIRLAILAATIFGRTVHFPAGTYATSATIAVPSNITLFGDGRGQTIIREHSSLGAQRVLSAIGTSGSRLANITLRDLTIRNGTASAASYTAGMDGMRAEYVDGLRLENVEFTEIQGVDGLAVKFSTKVTTRDCRWYRCTYSMFTVLPECDGITVQFCEFDTLTSVTEANVYAFAVGGEALGEGDYFCKNVRLLDNRFLNNPRWEGIDFHGGENIWIERNHVENAFSGLLLACATGFVANPVMKNVWVRDNTFLRGAGTGDREGIDIAGSDDGLVRAENIHVTGNRFVGFGGYTDTNLGTIKVSTATNVHITGNQFDQYAMCAIMLYADVRRVWVETNVFKNCANPTFSVNTCAIYMRSAGVFGCLVADNELRPDDLTLFPAVFFLAASKFLSVQFRNNTITQVGAGTYGNVGFLPAEKTTVPTTNLILKYGDAVLDDKGQIGWYVSAIGTSGKVGYGSLDTTTVPVTATIAAGSKTATIAASASNYVAVPEGMNVSIAGAGVAGGALRARVVKNNLTSIDLDTAASTSVVAANLTYQSLTLVQVARTSASATYDPPSLADGVGATTTVTVTGAALGDYAEASFSRDLQGITLTAWVSAADTVSVRFQNESGGVLDLASGTLRVSLRPK